MNESFAYEWCHKYLNITIRFESNILCISYLAFWRRPDVIGLIVNSAELKKCPLKIRQIESAFELKF